MALQTHAYLIQHSRDLYGIEPWIVAGAIDGEPDPLEQATVPSLVISWLGTPLAPPPGEDAPNYRAIVVDHNAFVEGQVPSFRASDKTFVAGSGGGGGVVFTEPGAAVPDPDLYAANTIWYELL